jgi:hypothetical protein
LAAYPLPNGLDDGVPSAEIHHRLQQQYGEECLSRTRVFEWCKCFREGTERVENEPHDRRTTTPSSRLFESGYAANHKPCFEKGIRMLPELWKKCVDSGGEYVED